MRFMKKLLAPVILLAMIAGMFPAIGAEAAAKPAKAKVTVQANDDGKSVTLTVAKTKNAEGYKIMVKKPGAKKFTKLTTLKEDGTKARTYTVKKLTEGEYQFKVRAYLKSGSKTVWGKYSKAVSVTVGTASVDENKIDVGYITKKQTVIETEYLIFDIEPNVYVVPGLADKADEIFRTMEKVTGRSVKDGKYCDKKITVHVNRTGAKNTLYENSGVCGGTSDEIWIAPSDLFVDSAYAFTHELGHAFNQEFTGGFAGTVMDEGFTTYTEMKIADYLAENDPDLGAVQGPSFAVKTNMRIDDYALMYGQSVEYWMSHTGEAYDFCSNGAYGVGFRLMGYLEEKFGDYTAWFEYYDKLAADEVKKRGVYVIDELPGDVKADLAVEALKKAYGKKVLDNFYPWMKKNQDGRFDCDYHESINRFLAVKEYTVYPLYWWGTNTTELSYHQMTEYNDLTVNIAPVEFYLREYKGEDTSKLVLNVSEGTTVELYDYYGKLLDKVQDTQISLTGVASVKLVGTGATVFSITGYNIYVHENFDD